MEAAAAIVLKWPEVLYVPPEYKRKLILIAIVASVVYTMSTVFFIPSQPEAGRISRVWPNNIDLDSRQRHSTIFFRIPPKKKRLTQNLLRQLHILYNQTIICLEKKKSKMQLVRRPPQSHFAAVTIKKALAFSSFLSELGLFLFSQALCLFLWRFGVVKKKGMR